MWRTTLRSLAAHKRRLLATASSVLLGVAFLAGTLGLADTMTRGYSDQFGRANEGIDALVRSSFAVGVEELTERGPVDASLADRIAAVDGVAAVASRIEGRGRIVGVDGDPVGEPGEPTLAGGWIAEDDLNPYDVAEGRAPAAPGEVVVDRRAAEEGDLAVGDTTVLLTPDPVDVTIVGLVTFGPADSQGPATYAGLAPTFAEQVLVREPGLVSGIVVAADEGVSPAELAERLDAVLPAGVESVTGAELTAEMVEATREVAEEFVGTVLAVFAVVSLVVATFGIYNTFSILVAQRTRESALLRALGASRRQVLRSVAVESLAVGVVASVGGLVAGLALATGLLRFMDALGRSIPRSSPTLGAGTVAVALAVGVVVTLAASVVPAVRASRVAPLAALRDVAVDRSATSRARAVAGAAVAGTGILLAVVGAAGEAVAAAGLGALATLAGVVVLGPVVARPAAALLGGPAAAWGGTSAALARRNAMRNPKRTAGTAAPLMLGVAVVSLLAIVAASLTRSVAEAIDTQFTGDLVIIGEGEGGLSADLAPAVAGLDEVAAVSTLGVASVRVEGRNMFATTMDPATIGSVVEVDMDHGALADVGPTEVAVSAAYARGRGLALGDPVTVEHPDGATERYAVAAIYADGNVSPGGEVVLHRDAARPHTSRPVDANMLIALADGVPGTEGAAAVQRVADRFAAPDVQTNDEYTESVAGEISELLTIVYALLAMAIVIAVMGIANTLALSIHERTRELGLLRAVGQTRRQVRAMVRGEALTVALFGTAGGVGLGLFAGWALVRSLAAEGLTAFAIPAGSLAAVLALGAVAGIAAATRPARRAARTDILSAIATE